MLVLRHIDPDDSGGLVHVKFGFYLLVIFLFRNTLFHGLLLRLLRLTT